MSYALLALAFTALPPAAWSATRSIPLSFERIGVRDGLSQSTVMDIHQDRFGYIWLATENGLNRFDGHDIRAYYRQAGEPGQLRSDYIWAIDEDATGNLWLGTDDGGVTQMHREDDRFDLARLTGQRGDDLTDARIYDLLVASDGTVWVGTREHGVIALTANGRPFAQFLNETGRSDATHRRAITSLEEAEDGTIWVGSQRGAHRIQRPSNTVTSYVHSEDSDVAYSLATNNVSHVMEDRHGRIWIATFDSGVSRLNPDTGQFKHFRADTNDEIVLVSNRVRALLEDNEGRIWVGTQSGITLIFPDESYQTIRHEAANQYSLPNDFVMSLAQDTSGLVWIGTRGGGVATWNPRSWSLGPRTPVSLSGVNVNAFLKPADGDGTVWIGTIGSGVLSLDEAGNASPAASMSRYVLSQNSVMSLLRDDAGIIWIGTLADSLLRYDPRNDAIQSLPVDPAAQDALGAPGIMSLAEGPPGTLWVGTYNGGVARVDTQTLSVERLGFSGTAIGLERLRATALAIVRDRQLWIGTETNGLIRVDIESGDARRFRSDAAQAGRLPSDTIYSLYADADENLWIGTGAQGLAKLSRDSIQRDQSTFSVISTADGLSSNVIYGIKPDPDGRLWLSSNNGLMRYTPATGEIRTFHEGHGSFSNEFNFGAHYRADDGTLYFGGPGGFNVIDPMTVEWNAQPPRILLSDILLYGEPLSGTTPPYLRDSLVLAHNENVVAFEFAATDYTAPDQNLYSVKLEGFDKNWSPPSTRSRATYTNLDPGSYTLKIRAANSDGVWTPEPYTLPIRVTPAPWATWWAYGLYTAAALLLLWWVLRLNFRAQERNARFNQLAYYDRITGLPNRELFEQRTNELLRRAEGGQESLSVLCVRIAVPKQIAQSMQQQLLNDMWQTLASRLMRAVHGQEQPSGRRDLARLDSDHFVVFFQTTGPDDTQALAMGERLRLICTESLTIGQHRVPISASVGMAQAPQHAADADSLIRYAATAASSHSRPQAEGVVVYNEAMTTRVESRLALETQLRQAIANDELELHLQPKFCMDRRIVGAEALLRWHSDEIGWIPPNTFVALAEESNLIVELDTWVIRKACGLLASWKAEQLQAPQIAINLSAANLGDLAMVELLIRTCEEFDVAPAQLEVELTESALLTDMEQTRDALRLLKSHGFSIALDDFGTGYSSLTHLKTFAIDTVKIDREFVRDVDSEEQHASICSAIIALANSLHLNTVAEGVETDAQWEALRRLGCHEMQGFLFARPMPTADFAELIRTADADGAG